MSDVRITETGVYYDLESADYHAQHDWLSWSQMKELIPPKTPAHFQAARQAPRKNKRHFDMGHVVHRLVLGAGDEYVVVQALDRQKNAYDAADYQTVSAQRHRDEIYAEGLVPILRHELEAAQVMAERVKAHPIASQLLTSGCPEVSLFWVDPETGVKCRARIDWLPDAVEGRRLIVSDLKTADDASNEGFAKAAASHGYYGQWTHYGDGIKALGLDPNPAWLFIVVEKDAPHLVNVAQFAERDDLRLARKTVDHIRRLYAACTASDTWPGYGQGINDLQLPKWLHYQLEEAIS